jgi:hypothetical protein
MVTLGGIIAGGFGLVEVAKYSIGKLAEANRKANGRSSQSDLCKECNQLSRETNKAVATMATKMDVLVDEHRESNQEIRHLVKEQRGLNTILREYIAEERGRRNGRRDTGRHLVVPAAGEGAT